MQKILLILFCCGLAISTAYAQNTAISGVVLDSDGEPMIGATVVVKESPGIGTAVDIDGRFTLTVPNGAATLVVSFMGYKTVEVAIGSEKTLEIVMENDDLFLDEVTVVGYGTQRKVSVTGAVTAITSDEILKTPASNLQGALTGKLPGLTVVQASGQPGAENFTMRLRGISSPNGQNPLILVDGVPREENISLMDPNEIESMSILKDASATAVFGVRGANGVILITTKSGNKNSKPTLNVTAEYGLQNNTRDYQILNSWEYAVLRNESLINDGLQPAYSGRQIELYKNGESPLYPNTNWKAITLHKFAPMSRVNVNYSGGTDRVNYFANVGYINQSSLYKTMSKKGLGYDPSFSLDRYNFRTNLDIKVNSWISTGVKLAGYISSVNEPFEKQSNEAHFFGQIYKTNATVPNMFEKGTVMPNGSTLIEDLYMVPFDQVGNPSATMNRSGFRNTTTSDINATLDADFDLNFLTEGLSAKIQYSFDTFGNTTRVGDSGGYLLGIYTPSEVVGPDGEVSDNIMVSYRDPAYRSISFNKSSAFRYKTNTQVMLNYNRSFNEVHNVTGMVLGQYDDAEALSGNSVQLLPYRRLGVSGRVTYNYEYRYMAEVNAGYNGSEQFAPGKRFGLFPAASVGWIISEEEFLRDKTAISNLKVRASFGKVGNDQIGDARFLYLDNISSVGNSDNTPVFIPGLGGDAMIVETLFGNPDLTWEIAYKQNYGIDLGLFNNMLTIVTTQPSFSLSHFPRQRLMP